MIGSSRHRGSVPRWPSAIDRQHPLARGLQAIYLPGLAGEPTMVEMITRARPTLNGSAAVQQSNRGTILYLDGVDDYASYANHLPGIGGNNYTFACYAPRVGAEDLQGNVLWGSNTGSSFYWQITNAANDRMYLTAGQVVSVGVGNWYNGTDRSAVGVSTAGVPSAYLNGVSAGSSTSGTAPSMTTAAKAVRVGAWIGGVSWDFSGDMLVMLLSTAAWGRGEAALFHAAPLSMLAEYGRRTYFIPEVVAPGGFQAAWARNANTVVMAGVG